MPHISKNQVDVCEITNRYTDELVVVPEVINELVDPGSQLRILRELSERPATPAGLNSENIVSRKTAHNHLTTFADRRWIERNDGQYILTTVGAIVLRNIEECIDTVGQNRLAALTRTPFNVRLLRTAAEEPIRPSDIAVEDHSPSRSRITQIRSNFEEHGWVQREQGRYDLTDSGGSVLCAYNDLASTIEQVMDKAPFLQSFEAHSMDIPLTILSSVDLITSSHDTAESATDAVVEACEPRVDQMRTVCPIFDRSMYERFEDIVDPDVDAKIVFDEQTYRHLCHPKRLYQLLLGFAAPNVEMRVYPDNLTFGIGVYDEQTSMIAAYAESDRYEAGIIGTDDDLVAWTASLFDDYWQQSQPLPVHMKQVARRYAERTLTQLVSEGATASGD